MLFDVFPVDSNRTFIGAHKILSLIIFDQRNHVGSYVLSSIQEP